jgi:hypothetical protein
LVLNVLNGNATKLAEQMASPGLVLPWLFSSIGAPTALAGLLVPVKQAGSLLPQLAVAGRIRAFPKRKWFWVGAGATQATLLALIVPAAMLLPAVSAGWIMVALLALFSVASGVGSVAFKDVLAKTIPKGKRGRLLAARATFGGLLTLVAGGTLRLYVVDGQSLVPYVVLIAGAAVLWGVAAVFFAGITEEDGATEGGRNALEEALAGIRLIREVPGFRRFIMARIFLLSIELSLPFYALFARDVVGASIGSFGGIRYCKRRFQHFQQPDLGAFRR